MTASLAAAWERFKDVSTCGNNAVSLLNPPCSVDEMVAVENISNVTLPPALKALLAMNNGQRMDEQKPEAGLLKGIAARAIEKIHFPLPNMLIKLLELNIGRRVCEREVNRGIFKSVHGWDVYEKHIFLSVQAIGIAYQAFVNDEVLAAEFGLNEIPFAVAVIQQETCSPEHYKEAFCINSMTGVVSLILTQYYDPNLPPEWLVYKLKRAESLTEFIEKQIEQYN